MAISATLNPVERAGWQVNADSADVSGTEILRAVVAGESHYIESVVMDCKSAINATILDGAIEIVGPVEFTTNGVQKTWTFTRPVKITVATAITIDASASGQISVVMTGYTK